MVKACRFSPVRCIGFQFCNHLDDGRHLHVDRGDLGPHYFDTGDLDTRACPLCGKERMFFVERIDMSQPSREVVEAVRADIRAQIADATGWDKLPDAEAFSDAMRVLPAKAPLCKVLASLLDWHRYAVNVGILTLAA